MMGRGAAARHPFAALSSHMLFFVFCSALYFALLCILLCHVFCSTFVLSVFLFCYALSFALTFILRIWIWGAPPEKLCKLEKSVYVRTVGLPVKIG